MLAYLLSNFGESQLSDDDDRCRWKPLLDEARRVDSSGYSENYGLHGIRSETSQVAITQASMGICERTF